MRVIEEPGQRVPIHVWARSIDEGTVRQLKKLASQPWVVDRVAAMADAHVAEGVAVGTVFATEHHLIPDALGGDLGCGMIARRFAIEASTLDREALRRIVQQLGKAIPVGDATHRGVAVPDDLLSPSLSTRSLDKDRDRLAPRHFGTLGGGNHFLELDRDADDHLWAIVHTGSRGIGGAIAAHHRRAAGGALGALDVRTDPGRAYAEDLALALAFARSNRAAIMDRVIDVLGAPTDEVVDVHHNFAALEAHEGRSLWVHRKGATPALDGQLGLIPGSMGTATYVVRGHGAAASFCSCSHGAGRVMTRKEARASIKPEALKRQLGRVVYDESRLRDLAEEAPGAYRDIKEVLEDQADLVAPVRRLTPLAVLKG